MNKIIAQKLKFRQSVIKYSFKFGVSETSRKFNVSRKTIYRWRNRFDGSIESLMDYSKKTKYHPNQHTEQEIQMIKNYKNNNKDTGLVVLWIKLRQHGYSRTIQGLYHVMRKLGLYKKVPSKKKNVMLQGLQQPPI